MFLGFSLRTPLGRGAFAQVFLAAEAELGNRTVVLKISHHGAAEAATLGRLRHDHIVPVYSVHRNPDTGLTAVVMPYLGSATLCDVLDRAFAGGFPTRARVILEAARAALPAGELAPARHPPEPLLEHGTYVDGAVLLAAQLAEALDMTHRQRILHRDLKPSNILLTPDGRPMLLDFNLSFDEQCTDQRLGGTLPYMAPEHLRATDAGRGVDPTLVDARSDLFSLGVILFELLTGKHPFGPIPSSLSSAQVREYLGKRQKAGPRPLRSANPHVDRPLAQLIERCLAFDPQDRPQSAGELAAALRAALTRRSRGRRWLIRHARVLLATVVLASAVGGTASYVSSRPAPPRPSAWEAGLEAYYRQNFEEAVERFSQALQEAPGDPWLLFARGRIYLQQAIQRWVRGEDVHLLCDKALEDFEQAEHASPDGRIPFCIGLCYSFWGKNADAIEAYQRARTAGFQPAELLNNLAYCYSLPTRKGKPEEALKLLNEAIAVKPDLAVAYYNRAIVRYRMLLRMSTKGASAWSATREAMMADVLQARDRIPPGAEAVEFYEYAAFMAALAVRDEDRWDDLARELARRTIAYGRDPKQLKNQLITNSGNESLFEGLPNAGPPRNPARVLRWVDAIPGIPHDLRLQPEINSLAKN
jgi:tetratricopeptide (TPR) repeat protein